jgi:hypothetical protein
MGSSRGSLNVAASFTESRSTGRETKPVHTELIPRPPGRRWLWMVPVVSVPLAIAGLSIAFTARLEPPAENRALAAPEADKVAEAESRLDALAWPDETLSGIEAKQLLLDVLLAAEERLSAVPGYTATLRKQERLKGKLGPEFEVELKVRHEPFAVYMRFIEPETGKEVVYAKGRYDDHLIAHAGGVARALVPRLKVKPDSALALAGNRHPITDCGVLNLTRKLIRYRRWDLEDDDAGTILDRVTDGSGETFLRSIHTHTVPHPDRPFAYVEVLYDPETKLPVSFAGHDWPDTPGDETPPLGERYVYEDMNLAAPLTDLDFDPANPAYEFHRF